MIDRLHPENIQAGSCERIEPATAKHGRAHAGLDAIKARAEVANRSFLFSLLLVELF